MWRFHANMFPGLIHYLLCTVWVYCTVQLVLLRQGLAHFCCKGPETFWSSISAATIRPCHHGTTIRWHVNKWSWLCSNTSKTLFPNTGNGRWLLLLGPHNLCLIEWCGFGRWVEKLHCLDWKPGCPQALALVHSSCGHISPTWQGWRGLQRATRIVRRAELLTFKDKWKYQTLVWNNNNGALKLMKSRWFTKSWNPRSQMQPLKPKEFGHNRQITLGCCSALNSVSSNSCPPRISGYDFI